MATVKRLALVLLLLLVASCSSTQTPSGTVTLTHAPSSAARCHYRQQGTDPLMVLPDATCNPGVTNPNVTQANIKTTICKTGWTSTVRPLQSATRKIKVQSLKDYGLPATALATTELDHLLPLEVGGSPADPRNLWVEPNYTVAKGGGYVHNPKDALELQVRNAICSGKLTLLKAQAAMTNNWTTIPHVLFGKP